MTTRYEVTKALHKNDWLDYCVKCKRISIYQKGEYIEYEIPHRMLHSPNSKVSGAICADCFSVFRNNKLVLR
jgi:hypothetical protein